MITCILHGSEFDNISEMWLFKNKCIIHLHNYIPCNRAYCKGIQRNINIIEQLNE